MMKSSVVSAGGNYPKELGLRVAALEAAALGSGWRKTWAGTGRQAVPLVGQSRRPVQELVRLHLAGGAKVEVVGWWKIWGVRGVAGGLRRQ